MDAVTREWNAASPQVRAAITAAVGDYTARDLALAKVIARLCIDVCKGNKPEADAYLTFITEREPEVKRLMAGYGILMMEVETAKAAGKIL